MAASIATDIRIRIAEGQLRCGDQLPALPELAAEFGVSRPTIRECLRVLEMEGLVDLRTGSRNGATVLEPTADTAGQLAAVVLAAAQTRMADVAEARRLIEPPVMELVAARIDPAVLSTLPARLAGLKHIADDTPAFIAGFEDLESDVFSGAQNPAISVATAVIHWVSVRCRRDVTIRALSVPQVIKSNRRSCASFAEFVAAADDGDVRGAARAWAAHLDEVAPFYRSSFGDRLIGDLFD
jgi:DNA-binding FadR family transcriptional regulator